LHISILILSFGGVGPVLALLLVFILCSKHSDALFRFTFMVWWKAEVECEGGWRMYIIDLGVDWIWYGRFSRVKWIVEIHLFEMHVP